MLWIANHGSKNGVPRLSFGPQIGDQLRLHDQLVGKFTSLEHRQTMAGGTDGR